MWIIKYSKQAVKDSKKIEQSNLKQSVIELLEVLKANRFDWKVFQKNKYSA